MWPKLQIDTPLVTVVGARLVARGSLESAAITNEAELRYAVFDRFIDEYTTARPNDGFEFLTTPTVLCALCWKSG